MESLGQVLGLLIIELELEHLVVELGWTWLVLGLDMRYTASLFMYLYSAANCVIFHVPSNLQRGLQSGVRYSFKIYEVF